MKAIYWHDETMGADYSVEEIPANLVDEANEWRDKMLEKVAEFDEALMEKYFEDPSTITEEEILRALRAGTLKMEIVVLHSRTKACRRCWIMSVLSCLLRWILRTLSEQTRIPELKKTVSRAKMKKQLLWHLRLLPTRM